MIIIADIHLGKTNDSFPIDGVPSQTMDIRKRLNTVLARAKLTKQAIVIAGDIFNRVNPTTQAIAEFFEWLSLCNSAHILVYLLGGNHDSGVDWSSMEMFYNANLPNVLVATGATVTNISEGTGIEAASRDVLLWSHMPLAQREAAEQGHGNVSRYIESQWPGIELIITHGMLRSDKYDNEIFFEAGDAMEIDVDEFRSLELLVLGHIHEHRDYKDIPAVYPGSLTINNFGEVDEKKGWVEVNLNTLAYHWYEFPDDVTSWVHVELDLTEKDESEVNTIELRQLVQGAVVKVTVLAKAHGVVSEVAIRKMFNEYGHVSRFETKVTGETASVTTENRLSHKALLTEFLNNSDADEGDRRLALKMGMEIIEEVRA